MKKSVEKIKSMKGKEKVTVITCYDYSFAKAVDGKIDMILVGDSLGNVVLGFDRTKNVEIEDMIRHLKAVRKGAKNTFVVCDLPYGSYGTKKDAIKNAKLLIDEGADAVKPEGKPEIVRALVDCGIPVMGHVGLLPQTAEKLKVIGRECSESEDIIKEAEEISKAGAFCVVIESVPSSLGKEVSEKIEVPTIGIGAGKECDGQVLVLYDMLGLYPDFEPKFVRKYLNLKDEIGKAIEQYNKDVKKGEFPNKKESFE